MNFKECNLCEEVFWRFVVFANDIKPDLDRDHAIREWLMLQTFKDGLASFYRSFINNFDVATSLINSI